MSCIDTESSKVLSVCLQIEHDPFINIEIDTGRAHMAWYLIGSITTLVYNHFIQDTHTDRTWY